MGEPRVELRKRIGRAVSEYLHGTDDPDYQIADVVMKVVQPLLDELRYTRMAAEAEAEGLDNWQARAEEWQERAEYSRQQAERLFKLLWQYGRHAEGCSAELGDQYRCRCGWQEKAPGG